MVSAAARDYYAILGLARRDATDASVRRAYLQQALRHHPDKDDAQNATEHFQLILEAYEALCTADGRAAYDNAGTSAARLQRTRAAASESGGALMEACRRGDAATAARLVQQGAKVDAVDGTKRTALMVACQSCPKLVPLLIKCEADVNARNCAGWTPLFYVVGANHAAAMDDRLNCLRRLIAARANTNAATTYGVTPLMHACVGGSLELVDILLESAAEPDARSDIGFSPLVFAADSGHAAVVRRLLAISVCVDCRYGNGKTALMSASALAHLDVVDVLLEAGADPNLRTQEGYCALMYATDHTLEEALASPAEGVQKPRAAEVAAVLLRARADVEAVAEDGRTPLRLAAQSGSVALAKVLLRGAADTRKLGADGRSALDLARSDWQMHRCLARGVTVLPTRQWSIKLHGLLGFCGSACQLLC